MKIGILIYKAELRLVFMDEWMNELYLFRDFKAFDWVTMRQVVLTVIRGDFTGFVVLIYILWVTWML